eukprot:scaffold383813_cov11-Prasinocladus_malaysianus.AAC.1
MPPETSDAPAETHERAAGGEGEDENDDNDEVHVVENEPTVIDLLRDDSPTPNSPPSTNKKARPAPASAA